MRKVNEIYTSNVRSFIRYSTPTGSLHSNLDDVTNNPEKFRALLHIALDDWLNNSQGSGFFVVGNPETLEEYLLTANILADPPHTLAAIHDGEQG